MQFCAYAELLEKDLEGTPFYPMQQGMLLLQRQALTSSIILLSIASFSIIFIVNHHITSNFLSKSFLK